LVALHNPLDGAFAVHNVAVSFFWNVGYGDSAVVDDGVFLPFLGEAHFFDGEVAALGAGDGNVGAWRSAFVVEVEVGKRFAGFAEVPEGARFFDEGDAREHLFQVVGKADAVVGAVEKAIDVVENIFFGDAVAVHCLCAFEDEVRYAIAANVVVFFGGIKECGVLFFLFFVVVERECLCISIEMKIRNKIGYQNRK